MRMTLAIIAMLFGSAGIGVAGPAGGGREQPRGSLSWFKLGVELARQGEFTAALNRFRRARQLSPNWALPHLEIAVAHLRTDNDRKVIGESLARAVELGPEIPRARYLYGVFFQEQGERPKAVREFVHALKQRPSMLDARFRLATLYVEEGRQTDGITQFTLVLEQHPSHLGARRNLAVLFEQSGRIEEAEKHLIAIARMDPKNAWHQTGLGRFYERVGWSSKARQAFRKAQNLEPTGDRRRLRPLLKSRN